MNRRLIVFAVLMGILLSLAIVEGPATAQQHAQGASGVVKGRVISDGLRLRSQPSSTAAQIGLLRAGTLVTVIGKNSISTWLLVSSPTGLTGWVGSPYVAITQGRLRDVPVRDESAAVGTPEGTEGAPEAPCPPAGGTTSGSTGGTAASTGVRGRVVSDGLRVRAEPNSTAAQVGLLRLGAFVTIVGKNSIGTWLLVTSDTGLTGWVGSAYVRVVVGSLKDVPISDQSAAPEEAATASATEGAPQAATPCPTEEAPQGTQAASTSNVKGRVISDGLRVRAQPSSTAAQVGLLKAAEFVTVLGKNSIGTWLLIQSDSGLRGWVGSPYIAITQGSLKDVPVTEESAS
jgi:uncharacterized protein YgiM (DUF1202 family)